MRQLLHNNHQATLKPLFDLSAALDKQAFDRLDCRSSATRIVLVQIMIRLRALTTSTSYSPYECKSHDLMHLDQPLILRVMTSIGFCASEFLLRLYCIKLRLVSLKTHQNARSKIVDYTSHRADSPK